MCEIPILYLYVLCNTIMKLVCILEVGNNNRYVTLYMFIVCGCARVP